MRQRGLIPWAMAAITIACGAVSGQNDHVSKENPDKANPVAIEKAVEELGLKDDQKKAADKIVEAYRHKEQQARKDLLDGMKTTLTRIQFDELVDAMTEPGAAVTFSGGYDTDPRDRGRPVVLIAAALNVPADAFRKAFTGVKPAPAGQQPDPEQVHKNKDALLNALRPYAITNDQLDEVSNYYRYNRSQGEMWRHTPATARAIIRDGVVTGFMIIDAGSGYSSPPKISIEGMPDVKAEATLRFGTDFGKNGSIETITIVAPASGANH